MSMRIAINGFGRIGRATLKAIVEHHPNELEVVAINDLYDIETLVYLFKYDSVYGRFDGEVSEKGRDLVIDGRAIRALQVRDLGALPWGDLGVDLVIESTGVFTKAEQARGHLEAGAKKVLISAPAKGEDLTIVMGVNEDRYDPARHRIVSNASCTTNCLAPVAKVLNDHFGIEYGLMTTTHAYTASQGLVDGPHKKPARGRAAALNIVPTTSGAAQAVELVLPELAGRFTGLALRVPVPAVSMVDLTGQLSESTDAEAVNEAFQTEAHGSLRGILDITDEPLVSSDFIGESHSSVVDGSSTTVIGGRFFKVLAWYDNEWGYSCRTADAAAYMGERGID